MIKAVGRSGDGTPLLVLGLSRENRDRLGDDKPIIVDTADLGLHPLKIVVVGGETEASIMDSLTATFNHIGQRR